jgi:hypothetical protein
MDENFILDKVEWGSTVPRLWIWGLISGVDIACSLQHCTGAGVEMVGTTSEGRKNSCFGQRASIYWLPGEEGRLCGAFVRSPIRETVAARHGNACLLLRVYGIEVCPPIREISVELYLGLRLGAFRSIPSRLQ